MSYGDGHPFSMAQGMNLGMGRAQQPQQQMQQQGGKMDVNNLLKAWFSGGNMSQLGGHMGGQMGQQPPQMQTMQQPQLGQQLQPQQQIYGRNFFQPPSRYGLLGG